VSGANDSATVSGANDSATVSGANDSATVSGANDSATVSPTVSTDEHVTDEHATPHSHEANIQFVKGRPTEAHTEGQRTWLQVNCAVFPQGPGLPPYMPWAELAASLEAWRAEA